MAENYVPVTVDDFRKFTEAARKLAALEAAGVDNWEGYGEAMRELYGEEDEED